MRSWPVLVSLTVVVTMGVAYPVAAGSSADERAERVRTLRRQVEQNDAQIRVLEATVRKLQAGKVGAEPARHTATPGGSLGEISAWSSTGPTPTAPAPAEAPAPPSVGGVREPIHAPRSGRPATTPPRRRGQEKSFLARAPLKVGMTQVTVWETLGPPEFVRGRRTEVQYWHYGPGWIRFQAGRITRWEPGSNQLRAEK